MKDVVIAGAGPVGLMAAMELTRHGVPTSSILLIDKLSKPCMLSRGVAIHARTLELLSYHPGLVERLMALGVMADHVNVHLNGSVTPSTVVNLLAMQSRFAGVLLLSQFDTESVMAEYARETYGIQIERECQLSGITLRPDHVLATIQRRDGGENHVITKYLVGCDGGHSFVRKWLKAPFEGHRINSALFYNLDVHVRTNRAAKTIPTSTIHLKPYPGDQIETSSSSIGDLNIFAGPNGIATLIRCDGRDLNRFRIILPDPYDPLKIQAIMGSYEMAMSDPEYHWITMDEKDPLKLDLKEMEDILNKRAPGFGFELFNPIWTSVVSVQERKVDDFFHFDRIFLAGDAAHIHSPVGGQGLNTGIQDSVNLGWKLAHHLQHLSPHLLPSYTHEREPIATAVLRNTTNATDSTTSVSRIPWFAWEVLGHVVAPTVGSFGVVHERVATAVGLIGVGYEEARGRSIALGEGGELVGRRAPDGKVVDMENGGMSTLHEGVFVKSRGHVVVGFVGKKGKGVSLGKCVEGLGKLIKEGFVTRIVVMHHAGSTPNFETRIEEHRNVVTHCIDLDGVIAKRYHVTSTGGIISLLLGAVMTAGEENILLEELVLVRPDGYVEVVGDGDKGVKAIVDQMGKYIRL